MEKNSKISLSAATSAPSSLTGGSTNREGRARFLKREKTNMIAFPIVAGKSLTRQIHSPMAAN